MVKREKETFEKTLASITNLCNQLTDIADADSRIQVLTKCQETAIALGEQLEKCSNLLDVRTVKEYGMIEIIEDFCEQVYVCSQDFTSRNIEELEVLMQEICTFSTYIPRTYRVVFLPYKASMWDSFESVWRCFAADERCETSVVPIPYLEANRELHQWDTYYEGDLYPESVPIVSFQEYQLEDKRPDIVFVHNPFDQYNYVTTVHPAYYSKELKKYCEKMVYIPYFVNPGFLSEDYNQLPLLYRADYIVLQSEKMKETAKGFPYYDRVLPFGSPKFDKVIQLNKEKAAPPEEWNIDINGKKKILLNTTISDFLENGEKLIEKLHKFFEKIAALDKIIIIWRPHPLLEGTIKAMRPQFMKKYQELVDYFNENQVGVFDQTADVSRAVAATDAYAGSHYSSMIALFEVCNKPVFCFDSQNIYEMESKPGRKHANAEDIFGMNGEYGFFVGHESMEYTFGDFVDDLIGERLEKVLENQRVAESGISNNLDGTCGLKLYKYLTKDWV